MPLSIDTMETVKNYDYFTYCAKDKECKAKLKPISNK